MGRTELTYLPDEEEIAGGHTLSEKEGHMHNAMQSPPPPSFNEARGYGSSSVRRIGRRRHRQLPPILRFHR